MRQKLSNTSIADELEIAAPVKPEYTEILSDEALRFVGKLIRRFTPVLELLLKARTDLSNSNQSPSAGHSHELPDFLPTTEQLRKSDWKIGNIPEDLQDRRVEITGPADRKMVIRKARDRTSTSPSSRATSRRAGGTKFLLSPNSNWFSSTEPSRPQF